MFSIIAKTYKFTSKKQWPAYFILFAIAFIVFLYASSPPTLLCPDGFYHTKMALLIKESGIVKNFPWTQFTTYKNLFVDHHFGYHLLLLPFLSIPSPANLDILSKQTDPLLKTKLASVLFASLAILTIYWFLRKLKIKFPLLWALSSFLTINFLLRLSLSRAPALSTNILLLALYSIIKKKYLSIFITSFLYVWIYGAWPLMLLTVVLYCISDTVKKLINKQSIKVYLFFKSFFNKTNIKLLCACAFGLLAGLIINPYFPKTFSFYWFQTIQIAVLSHQNIGVGAEWYAPRVACFYTDILPSLIPYSISIAWFLFFIKKQKTREWFFLFVSLFFFLYTLKARRIIEYLAPMVIIFNALIFTQIIESINWNNVKKQIKLLFSSTENIFYFTATVVLGSACIFFLAFYSIHGIYKLKQNYQNSRPVSHLQGATQWIKKNVPAQRTIFHSNWDIFPELFYFDDSHYYINGLDQRFMYKYSQELYNDWRDLFSGKTNPNETAKIIKEKFNASYIITSKDENDKAATKLFKRSTNLKKVYEDEQAIIYKIKI